MNSWITIATFMHPFQAHLAKTKLESEGIDVLIQDELTAQIYSTAIGGVKLQVEESNVEKATQILKESGTI